MPPPVPFSATEYFNALLDRLVDPKFIGYEGEVNADPKSKKKSNARPQVLGLATKGLDSPVVFGMSMDAQDSPDVVLAPKPLSVKSFSSHPKIVLKKEKFIEILGRVFEHSKVALPPASVREIAKKIINRVPLSMLQENNCKGGLDNPPGFMHLITWAYRDVSLLVPEAERKYPGPNGDKIPRFVAEAFSTVNPGLIEIRKLYPELEEKIKRGEVQGKVYDDTLNYITDLAKALRER